MHQDLILMFLTKLNLNDNEIIDTEFSSNCSINHKNHEKREIKIDSFIITFTQNETMN